MTIKGQDYKLKYTLRALFIYEQITVVHRNREV